MYTDISISNNPIWVSSKSRKLELKSICINRKIRKVLRGKKYIRDSLLGLKTLLYFECKADELG